MVDRSKGRRTHLLLGERLEIRRILGISLPAGRTQLILVRSDSVPTEPTDLVAASARIEAQVVDLQRLHAQRTLGQVISAGIHDVHSFSGGTSSLSPRRIDIFK